MNLERIQKIKQRYDIIGNYEGLNRAIDVALQVSATDLSVLIMGENGVGKEIFPRLIHDNSARKARKYFAVNCGSIPEGTIDSELFGHEKGAFTGAISERDGYFGSANGGTLFLDEVGELPLSTQARLLRVLETGEYIRVGSSQIRKTDVRIIAATNVNLSEAISQGKFRQDLYYRLNTIPITIPPLRDRGSDIVLLFKKFALEMSEKYHMPMMRLLDDAQEQLLNYSWPGNIRQLKNITEHLSVTSESREIDASGLAHYLPVEKHPNQLVTMNSGNTSHSFENEREILYKILFDLRRDVTELKKMMASQQNGKEDGMVNLRNNYLLPQGVKELNDCEVQQPEEYVEPVTLDELEKDMMRKALERNGNRRKDAARELNISERTLYRKIKEYGLDKD